MKNLLLYPLMLLMALTLSSCGGSEGVILLPEPEPEQPEQPDNNENDGNVTTPGSKSRYLVLFCSRSGNTEHLARQIQKALDCDLLEIEPAIAYEDDYDAMLERAQREQAAMGTGIYPETSTSVETLEQYETIFIGYPIWYGHMATPMQSFLHAHTDKLSGKRLALFATSSSSDISTSVKEARQLCRNAILTETLHQTSSTINQCESRIADWLKRLGTDKSDQTQPGQHSLKINITIGDRVITATMEDNVTTRDFLSRLPLEVTLNDYAGAEKIFYPNPALATEGAPRGNTSSRGDIDVYVPWGNIAFFYGGEGGYSNSMIHLGRIDGNDAEALDIPGNISMRIERQ